MSRAPKISKFRNMKKLLEIYINYDFLSEKNIHLYLMQNRKKLTKANKFSFRPLVLNAEWVWKMLRVNSLESRILNTVKLMVYCCMSTCYQRQMYGKSFGVFMYQELNFVNFDREIIFPHSLIVNFYKQCLQKMTHNSSVYGNDLIWYHLYLTQNATISRLK